MKSLTIAEIEQLQKAIEPFDRGIRSELNRNPGGSLALLINDDMRNTFGVHWDITARPNKNGWYEMDEVSPSEMIGEVLKKSLNCPDLEGIDDFLTLKDRIWNGESNEMSEDCNKIGKEPKHEYFYKVLKKIDDLRTTSESLTDIANWPVSNLDKTANFFINSLDGEHQRMLYRFEATLQETINKCNEMIILLEEIRDNIAIEIIDRADEELEGIASYLKENEDAFNMMDLKLHDASYYEYSGMEQDYPETAKYYEDEPGESAYYRFAEDSYDQFTDWCNEEKIDFDKMRHQVGRTSSFYLHDEGNGVCLSRRNYTVNIQDSLYCLLENHGYAYSDLKFTEDGKIDRDYLMDCVKGDDYEEVNNLLYIADGEFAKDIKNEYADVLKVYDYIKDFKENQVDYFKEWLDNEEEYCKEQNEQESER